jgi:acetoin utilization protein AcuB
MLVKDRMSHPVITVTPEMPIQEALDMMHREHVRRFPVIQDGRMVGIVSEADLLNASPSDATSLNVWEINYLLSKITVGKVMSKKVVTVGEDTPVEEAARIMADTKIGGLPVMRGDEVVGIITETNLFRIFLELLGAREKGIRLTAQVKNEPGGLQKLTKVISDTGANIIALGTFMGESVGNATLVVKANCVEMDVLRKAVEPVVLEISDLRETG